MNKSNLFKTVLQHVPYWYCDLADGFETYLAHGCDFTLHSDISSYKRVFKMGITIIEVTYVDNIPCIIKHYNLKDYTSSVNCLARNMIKILKATTFTSPVPTIYYQMHRLMNTGIQVPNILLQEDTCVSNIFSALVNDSVITDLKYLGLAMADHPLYFISDSYKYILDIVYSEKNRHNEINVCHESCSVIDECDPANISEEAFLSNELKFVFLILANSSMTDIHITIKNSKYIPDESIGYNRFTGECVTNVFNHHIHNLKMFMNNLSYNEVYITKLYTDKVIITLKNGKHVTRHGVDLVPHMMAASCVAHPIVEMPIPKVIPTP